MQGPLLRRARRSASCGRRVELPQGGLVVDVEHEHRGRLPAARDGLRVQVERQRQALLPEEVLLHELLQEQLPRLLGLPGVVEARAVGGAGSLVRLQPRLQQAAVDIQRLGVLHAERRGALGRWQLVREHNPEIAYSLGRRVGEGGRPAVPGVEALADDKDVLRLGSIVLHVGCLWRRTGIDLRVDRRCGIEILRQKVVLLW
mmetsp:Transcript_98285/g.278244  ORF Transcript_98285/g.278244 Transcript_98285/m.278244 type:complete len:202 (-) Transcript_98285:719-1324(-)